jgi:hypothetical protein
LFGGIGVAIVASLVTVFVATSKKQDDADPAKAPAPVAAPKAPHVPAATAVPTGTAKAGKTPARPAPALTTAMLGQAASLLDEAKALCNEGVKLRTAGDNQAARAKQSAAKDKIDAIKQLLAEAAGWQEEADLDGWAMPAEYGALVKIYEQIGPLEKRVRMSGGT